MKEFIRLIDITTNTRQYANLNHFTFTIFPGQIHYIIGLHGNGKTALQKVLNGELAPASGIMQFQGHTVTSFAPQSAQTHGVISIQSNTSFMIPSMSVYENIELLSPQKPRRILFERKTAISKVSKLLQQYHLNIDPSVKVSSLSPDETFLLHLLKAAYTNAQLLILNFSSLKLSYVNYQRMLQILKQMNKNGMALLLICDSYYVAPSLAGTIHIMQHGHIAKDYESTAITTEHLTQLLVPSATPNNNLIQKEKITGILELYYSNYSLPEYFGNLRSASQSESGNSFHNNVHFISSEGLECFCNNLSVGDNIALIHYSSVCGALGYIDDDILRYLEKEFSKVLSTLGVSTDITMDALSIAEKKILGIERWIMAGCKRLVIEEPLSGLDAKGQQLLLRYFALLRDRDIRLVFIFFNISPLQIICDITHICDHGKIIHTLQNNTQVNIEELLADSL